MRYIVDETRALFRKNAALHEADAIARCIEECEHRRELALHYRNARPRLHNAINVTPQQLRRSGQRGTQHAPTFTCTRTTRSRTTRRSGDARRARRAATETVRDATVTGRLLRESARESA